MKKFSFVLNLIILLIICLFGLNCKSKFYSKEKVPNDFDFIIEDGYNDSFDSRTCIFQRKYISDLKKIKVNFTNEEKVKIYKIIEGLNFNSLSEKKLKSKCSHCAFTIPSSTFSLTVFVNGKEKKISLYDGLEFDNKKARLFANSNTEIWTVIYKNKDISSVKESDYYYE